MDNSRGLLYPALHKFYSALSNFAKFEKGTNFFDNITYLDSFFSEYRNITFVLQKSLAHTEHKETYEQLRNQYLVNDVCKWFIDKRNEVLKQQPFDLEKRIVITIYSEENATSLPEQIFTVENDVKFSTIRESLKKNLIELDPLEVMFSAEFFFYENGHSKDLYDYCISGINHMKLFLTAMRKTVNQYCKLSDLLEEKIEKIDFYRIPKNMLFVDDYIYYCTKNRFEKGSRVEMFLEGGNIRVPVERLNELYPVGDLFQQFQLMHLITFQMQNKLLPTCLVLYDDNTFELSSFGGSIKTTIYRKLNEVARKIETDRIVGVYFVIEMYIYNIKDVKKLDSKEKIKHAKNKILSFFMVDNNLTKMSRIYETDKISDMPSVIKKMLQKTNKSIPVPFMNPIISEFEKLQAKS
ncbi:MAG TPA: hypothetical protein PK776_06450 [Flavobacterium sp.]|nr:hypothetical protein [Flavobacterium sp.]